MDEMLKYQCPNCGAPLAFSSQKQKLVCDSCDSEFAEDLFKTPKAENENPEEGEVQSQRNIDWNIEGFVRPKEIAENSPGFSCTSCAAEVVSDGNTVATECMYCGNPVVMTENISGMVAPDLVIPFKLDKDKALEALRNFYKNKPLLPSAFKDSNKLSKISGVYVPFWMFSCTGSGSVNFKATKVRRWSDSDYNYTRTEHFNILRAGSISFDKIPVDASTKMDDEYMDGIEPYDYSELYAFQPMYMAGYFADKFDVSVAESSERASSRVEQSVEDTFRKTVTGYTTVIKSSSIIDMHGDDIKYALLPVWMLNTKYNDTMYQFAINAQTGKIAGKLPIDKMKLWLYRLGIAVATAIPATFIANWLLS